MLAAMIDVLTDWALWTVLNPGYFALTLLVSAGIVIGTGVLASKALEG